MEGKIYLLYQAKIHPGFIEEIAIELKKVYSLEITIDVLKLEPPLRAYNSIRQQYNSDILLEYYASHFRVSGNERVAVLLDEDAYVPGLNFVFGEALPRWGGIVYLTRLKIGISTPSFMKLLVERTVKEIVHELGHSYGLRHCSNPRCVMYFSNSIMDTDYKSMFYCRKCRKVLDSRGLGYILKKY